MTPDSPNADHRMPITDDRLTAHSKPETRNPKLET